MNSYGSIDLTTTTKQAAERKMRFDSLVINTDHLQKMFERLVGLLIEQKVKPLQVIDVERRCRFRFITLTKTAQRPPGDRQQDKQPGEKKVDSVGIVQWQVSERGHFGLGGLQRPPQ